jgi:hypothetical protein
VALRWGWGRWTRWSDDVQSYHPLLESSAPGRRRFDGHVRPRRAPGVRTTRGPGTNPGPLASLMGDARFRSSRRSRSHGIATRRPTRPGDEPAAVDPRRSFRCGDDTDGAIGRGNAWYASIRLLVACDVHGSAARREHGDDHRTNRATEDRRPSAGTAVGRPASEDRRGGPGSGADPRPVLDILIIHCRARCSRHMTAMSRSPGPAGCGLPGAAPHPSLGPAERIHQLPDGGGSSGRGGVPPPASALRVAVPAPAPPTSARPPGDGSPAPVGRQHAPEAPGRVSRRPWGTTSRIARRTLTLRSGRSTRWSTGSCTALTSSAA